MDSSPGESTAEVALVRDLPETDNGVCDGGADVGAHHDGYGCLDGEDCTREAKERTCGY